MIEKPYAPSCDRNSQPILDQLKSVFLGKRKILEIGSGTGQHAVYFAKNLSFLTWVSSDLPDQHLGIKQWINEAGLSNIEGPIEINAGQAWPILDVDAIFTANTLHIMGEESAFNCIKNAGQCLPVGGVFVAYGPFNYQGQFTSESNRQFDDWLKARDLKSGIRNFEDLDRMAKEVGLLLINDIEMPANNRLLIWQK